MFFDKLAKLKSNVDKKGIEFTVNVFDDEISMEKPIMWLNASTFDADVFLKDSDYENDRDYLQENYEKVIYVDIVETNSTIYFNLPEARQSTCATSLFKRFILHYKQNFEGELVSANFENYDLQEKFKIACEKGIFPKDSLKIIGETTKQDYDQNERFNINNKEKAYNLLVDFSNQLKEKGLDSYTEGEGVVIRNSPVNDVYDKVMMVASMIEVQNDDIDVNIDDAVYGYLTQSGDYIFMAPIDLIPQDGHNFYYEVQTKTVVLLDYGENTWLKDFILQNEEKFREMFNGVLDVGTAFENPIPIDEFFQQNKVEANKKLRLVKKSQR